MKSRINVNNVNAVILAGGKNTRMRGVDKAFLEIEGKPFVEIIIDRLKGLVNQIIVVTNSPGKYRNLKVILVKDQRPGQGPLMGIYSGLKASPGKYNLVIACDMPFVSGELISYMLRLRDKFDVVVPMLEGRLHPLFGLYSKDCLRVIEETLAQGRRQVRSIFPKLNVRFLEKEELVKFDKDMFSLVNINTKGEYAKSTDYLPLLRGRM